MRSYFHSGLGESFTWIVSPAIPPLPRRSKLYLGPGTSLVLAAVRGLGSVLTVVLCFFLTCLWPGQVPRQVVLVPLHVVVSCEFVRMCS